MVRISVELINDSYQYINAVNQREISLRNLQIPSIENLGVTRVFFLIHRKKLILIRTKVEK